MSFDPLAAAIDWLHAYRSSDLETIINMYSDDAVIECGCCAMTTVTGKAALRTYWEQRFQDSVPSDLEDLQPSHEGAMITYQARNGTVVRRPQIQPGRRDRLLAVRASTQRHGDPAGVKKAESLHRRGRNHDPDDGRRYAGRVRTYDRSASWPARPRARACASS